MTLGERLPVDELHREIGRRRHRVDGEDVIADDRLVIEVVQRRRFLAEQRERRLVLAPGPERIILIATGSPVWMAWPL